MWLLSVGSLGSVLFGKIGVEGVKLSKFMSKCLSFISTIACQE